MDEAIGALVRTIGSTPRSTHAVSIVNAHTLNLATDDSNYRAVLKSSDFVFGDGTGVRWAARQRGVSVRDNLVGTDLLPKLFERHSSSGYSMFLLGSTDETAERAAEYCSERFTGWQIVGFNAGFYPEGKLSSIIDKINNAKPDILLVAMGNPLQEKWIHDNKHRLEVPVCIGVGGLFDHWAGNLKRAPKLVRKLGIEWLQILLQQPHKWRRYLLGNFLFVARMFRYRDADRKSSAVEIA